MERPVDDGNAVLECKRKKIADVEVADAEIAQVRKALVAMVSVPTDVKFMFSAALQDAVDAARPADRHTTQARMLEMIDQSFSQEELRLEDALLVAKADITAVETTKVETETKLRDLLADLMAKNMTKKKQEGILERAFYQHVEDAKAALRSARNEVKQVAKEWASKQKTFKEEQRVYWDSLKFLKNRTASTEGKEQAARSDRAARPLFGGKGPKKDEEFEVAKGHVKAVVALLKKWDLEASLLVGAPAALLKRTEERGSCDKLLWAAMEMTFGRRMKQADEELHGGHREREACNAANQKVRDCEDAIVAAKKKWKDHDAKVALRVTQRDALAGAFKETRKKIETVDKTMQAAVLQCAEAETALATLQEAARAFKVVCERGPAQRRIEVTSCEGSSFGEPSFQNPVETIGSVDGEAKVWKSDEVALDERRTEALKRREEVRKEKKVLWHELPLELWNAPPAGPS